MPAGTPVTLFAGCQVSFAEYIVWNDAVLTVADMEWMTMAMRTKWNVYDVGSVAGAVAASVTLGAVVTVPVAPVQSLPAGTPAPACWLDAASPTTLCADTMGLVTASVGQQVRCWRDRSGHGRHCAFPAGMAQYAGSPSDWLNGLPVIATSAPGVLATSPLAAGNYTIIAVWRLAAAGGGHPFTTHSSAVFNATEWTEAIDTTSRRSMPAPGIGSGESVVAAWTRAGSDVWFALRSPGDIAAPGGRVWAGTPAAED